MPSNESTNVGTSATDGDVAVTVEIWTDSDSETGPANRRHDVRRSADGYRAVIDGELQTITYASASECFAGQPGLHVVPPDAFVKISIAEGGLDVIATSLRCSGHCWVTVNGTLGEMRGADEDGLGVWFPEDFWVDWETSEHSEIRIKYRSQGSRESDGPPSYSIWAERFGSAWQVSNPETGHDHNFRAATLTEALREVESFTSSEIPPGAVTTGVSSPDTPEQELFGLAGAVWVNDTLQTGDSGGTIRRPPQSPPRFLALSTNRTILGVEGPTHAPSRAHRFPMERFFLVLVPAGKDLESFVERLNGVTFAEFSSESSEPGRSVPAAVMGMANGRLLCGIKTVHRRLAIQIARRFSGVVAVVAQDRSRLAYFDTKGKLSGPSWKLSGMKFQAITPTASPSQRSRLVAIEQRIGEGINGGINGTSLTWQVPALVRFDDAKAASPPHNSGPPTGSSSKSSPHDQTVRVTDQPREVNYQRTGDPPAFEWVFASNTILGGVAPGARDTRFNGSAVPYSPFRNVRGGARWCSKSWLRLGEGRTGTRGPSFGAQGAMSRFGMHIGGVVSHGTLVVIADDQLDDAAAFAASLLKAGHADSTGIDEWSTALVREPGLTRPAIRFAGGEDVRQSFAEEFDIEWFIRIGHCHVKSSSDQEWDRCEVMRSDGTLVKRPIGKLYADNEQVPTRLLEIARAHGNGLRPTTNHGRAINVPTASHRPLQPDERNIGRDR